MDFKQIRAILVALQHAHKGQVSGMSIAEAIRFLDSIQEASLRDEKGRPIMGWVRQPPPQ